MCLFGFVHHRGCRPHGGNLHRLTNRSRLTDWLLLIIFPAFFFLWKLSAFGLIGADEPRYAQVAREMLARHDWITPTLNGSPWLEKPPLYYWQAMIAYKLFGVSDWAARLPSVFDAFVLVLATYLILRRMRPGIELDGALIVATSAGVVGFARAVSMDMPLTATFGITMLAWYAWVESRERKYLAVAYLLLALATLAKGPVAPFLAVVIVILFAAVRRNLDFLWQTFWFPGILAFCAFALPWYVFVQLRNAQFFHEFIVEHNLARFGTNLYHHPEPFWYYVPVTLLGWVPWTALVLAAIIPVARRRRTANEDSLHSFLLIWIGAVVAFFSLSQSKLPGYVLPAIPAGAILCAQYLRTPLTEKGPLWKILTAGIHGLLSAALVFCAVMVQPLIVRHSILWSASAVPFAASLVVGVIVAVSLVKFDFRPFRIATLVPAILAVAFAIRLGAWPLDEKLSARPVANELASFDTQHLPVAVFLVPRETEFGLAFYRNQVVARYELGQVPPGEHFVVAAQGYPVGVAKAAGREVKFLENFAAQRLDLFYVPAQ